ncbi:lysozyme murein hydrolase [Pelagibacter phage HTVC119P]|jgi:lysozyme|uniref:Lysozyme murein hydrolase n=1 Tax=Pelagibacter phage HTVC119P TaxID=2283020 RepID=A0AC59HCK8_9CAUD|nr:lysozyme murein hydrolase [Pelagibacter phage HTVC119P]
MYTQLKERIKQHEGFRRTVYSDSLGFATIGYGHLVLPTDNFVEGVEYTKEELDKVFDVDFEKAVNGAKELIGNDSLLPQAEEVIIEMCFQLGKTGVSKFKNMWAYLDDGDYVAAGDEMLDSNWYQQTPSRALALSEIMKSCQL